MPSRELSLLRWTVIAAPLMLFAVLEGGHQLVAPHVAPWARTALPLALLVVLAAAFYHRVLSVVKRLSTQLERQNSELLALHAASLAVSADLAIESVLQTIVDRAQGLLRARYGALSVTDASGQITAFVTAGMDSPERSAIGHPPVGNGLLGVPLRAEERLRLDDLGSDPRAAGFPPHHPPMRRLLAVPIRGVGAFRGNLYLCDRLDDAPFTAEDEETLVRFARQAAVAIDNALLHRDAREVVATRERLRLAGDAYDGVAQVLAYVNTKSQVVREHCRNGRFEDAARHLDQLSAAARQVFSEHRARLLDLRHLPAAGGSSTVEAISEHVRAWQDEASVDVDLALPASIETPPEVELQLLRIVQEGLDNVRRHANAHAVRLSVHQEGDNLCVELADDGRGFDPGLVGPPSGEPHLGLAAMRQRASAVGGHLDVVSAPGEGTLLRLLLPAESRHRHPLPT